MQKRKFLIVSSKDYGHDVMSQLERAVQHFFPGTPSDKVERSENKKLCLKNHGGDEVTAQQSQEVQTLSIFEFPLLSLEFTMLSGDEQVEFKLLSNDVQTRASALASFFAKYDAILVDTCASHGFAHNNFFDLALQLYCDRFCGGIVLMAHAAYQGHCIGNNFNYLPFVRKSVWGGGPRTLKNVIYPHHAIFNHVTHFDGGSFSGHFCGDLDHSKKNYVILAEYDNAIPFAIEMKPEKESTGTVVMLNFTSCSYAVASNSWTSDSDGHKLMYNALMYVSHHCVMNKKLMRRYFDLLKHAQEHGSYCDVTVQFSL